MPSTVTLYLLPEVVKLFSFTYLIAESASVSELNDKSIVFPVLSYDEKKPCLVNSSTNDAPSDESRSSEYRAVSTSRRKCIPPARSNPKFKGLAPISLSHLGVEGSLFKAII